MIKATERILRFFLTAVGMAGFCLFLLPQTAGCTPAVPVGSIVYTNRWIKQENIKEGDIIAYGLSGGVSVLHRVVETDKNSRIWRTKGDANEVSDPGAVSYEQYLGKMIFSLPYVGYLISVFKRRSIWLGTITVGILLIILQQKETWKSGKEKTV